MYVLMRSIAERALFEDALIMQLFSSPTQLPDASVTRHDSITKVFV